MTPEAFHAFADMVPDGLLMLSGQGRIMAANRHAAERLEQSTAALAGQDLQRLAGDSPATVEEFLRICRRSPQEVVGALHLGGQDTLVRVLGRRLTPVASDAELTLLLRIPPRDESFNRFTLLNQKVDELTREVARRRTVEAELREQHDLAAFGRDVGRVLAEGPPQDELLQRCCELVMQHLHAAASGVWLATDAGDELVQRASAGAAIEGGLAPSRLRLGEGSIGRTALQQEARFEDGQPDDSAEPEREEARRHGAVAFAGYPLVSGRRTIGVLAVFSRRPLSSEATTALASVARLVALGVERKQAELRLQQQTRTLSAINAIHTSFAGELDLDRLVQRVTDAGVEVTQAAFGAFFYNAVDDAGEYFTLYAISGVSREAFERFPLPRNTALFNPTFNGIGVTRIDDVTRDPRFGLSPPHYGLPPGHLPVVSYLGVPVVSRTGEVHGGLFFGHPQPGVFTQQAEDIISGIAAQAAVAIDNARLFEAAQQEIERRKRTEQLLEQARDAATAANAAKSEFLANMSHEIRTPMTAILGYADILSRHLEDPDDLQSVATIRRNGRFLLDILNDILDISKIEAGKLRVEPMRLQPDVLVAEVVSLMEVRASEKQLPLEVEFDGPLPQSIQSDPTRLRQILVNLIGNAIKFTDEGSIRLVVRLLASQQLLEFQVIDTGIGMDETLRRRLFEPFAQADSSATRQHGGSGLGLAISNRLAQMLGGKIRVDSAPGRGSTFTVTVATGPLEGVPLAEARLAGGRPETVEPAPERRLDCCVLIADDRREVRYLAQHFVEEAGGRVITVTNGQQAVEAVQAALHGGPAIDVVLMDMQMPVMDGYQATARARDLGWGGPIIALTAHVMQGDREKCLRAGCDDYLGKPLDGRELVAMVARHAAAPESAAERRAAAALSGGARVLLVDDSVDLCQMMSVLLRMRGHEVRSAQDGASAIEAARQLQPEVVVLDLTLPDMSGEQVAWELRRLPEAQDAVLIAFSGRSELDTGTDESPFQHFVQKPVDVAELEQLFPAGLRGAVA